MLLTMLLAASGCTELNKMLMDPLIGNKMLMDPLIGTKLVSLPKVLSNVLALIMMTLLALL
jgi:hypothetical protein